jgi:hypothetical protein
MIRSVHFLATKTLPFLAAANNGVNTPWRTASSQPNVSPAIKPIKQNERKNIMTRNNSTVAIFKSHIEAETAVKELQQSGFDMKKLSIVGRGYQTDENVIGCCPPAPARKRARLEHNFCRI